MLSHVFSLTCDKCPKEVTLKVQVDHADILYERQITTRFFYIQQAAQKLNWVIEERWLGFGIHKDKHVIICLCESCK